jgi:hypothetical protein
VLYHTSIVKLGVAITSVPHLCTEVGFTSNRRAKAVNTDTVWLPYSPWKELLGGSLPNFGALKRPWVA